MVGLCSTRLIATAQTGHWKQSSGRRYPDGRSIHFSKGLVVSQWPQCIVNPHIPLSPQIPTVNSRPFTIRIRPQIMTTRDLLRRIGRTHTHAFNRAIRHRADRRDNRNPPHACLFDIGRFHITPPRRPEESAPSDRYPAPARRSAHTPGSRPQSDCR